MSSLLAADVIVPTCRPAGELELLRKALRAVTPADSRVILTCQDASAAVNRNYGLDRSITDIAIMVDDDIEGFAPDWHARMIEPLLEDPNVVMVSANLLNPDGSLGQMLGDCERPASGCVPVPRRELPTACIAIRHDGTRFDERFVGSGWEDTDFSARLRGLYPRGVWLINCDCRVVHRNEQKNQGEHFARNKALYESIWGKPLGAYA